MPNPLSLPNAAFYRPLCAVLCCLGVLVVAAKGQDRRDRKDKAELVETPPPCVPQDVKVTRGEDVVIPLRIYGGRNQQLTFLIRKPPQTGQLSGMKYTTTNAAIIHYRSTKDLNVHSDVFEYAVKSNEGVSAAVPVKIEIVDQPPELFGPSEVLFPHQLTGSREVQTIELINRGGMVAEGECAVQPPWRLEGEAKYRVEPGGRLFARVAFEPQKAGDFLGELRLSSQPQLSVILRGIAQDALALKPPQLKLSFDAVTLVRTGVFEVTNNTGGEQVVRVTSNARLHHEPELRLGPGQTAPMMVRTKAEDAEVLDTEIALEAGEHQVKLPVTALPLPAVIRATERVIDLGLVPGGTVGYGKLVVRNSGGVSGWATITVPAPFRVDPMRVDLAPGASAEVAVVIEAHTVGTVEQSLQVRTSTAFTNVPVRAIVVAPGSVPPRSASSRSSSDLLSGLDAPPPATPAPMNAYDLDLSRPDPRLLVRPVLREPTRCILEWHAELSNARKFIAQRRELKIDGEKLLVSWVEMPGFWPQREGERVRGNFEKLRPGHRYNVRVLEVVGDRQTQIFETSFYTPLPPSRGPKIAMFVGLAVGVAAIVAFVLWKRSRQPVTPTRAFKKTQRIY